MKYRRKILIFTIFVIFFSLINILIINYKTKNRILDYTTMIASKVTKYIVNNAYIREKINYYANDIYDVIKSDTNEIKNIVYDSGVINDLMNSITNRIYNMFNMLETSDLESINIRENILVADSSTKDGIVLEVPTGIVFENYILANLGPRIPVKISMTGEFESYVSSEVKEYGINNALITISITIKATERITMPFITEAIEIENKIPIFISMINGSIPNYYIGGFVKNSNLF